MSPSFFVGAGQNLIETDRKKAIDWQKHTHTHTYFRAINYKLNEVDVNNSSALIVWSPHCRITFTVKFWVIASWREITIFVFSCNVFISPPPPRFFHNFSLSSQNSKARQVWRPLSAVQVLGQERTAQEDGVTLCACPCTHGQSLVRR